MDYATALKLTTYLFSHYPGQYVEEVTAEVYAGHLSEFENVERARYAIDLVVNDQTITRLPAWSVIKGVYYSDATRQKFEPKALPEPPLTEEQRQENLQRMRELVERYSIKAVDDDVRPV